MSAVNDDIREVTEKRRVVSTNAVASGESFSVVSYNILADCWVKPEWYEYTPADCRTSLQRHDRLMAELDVLDGDIICLQEVGVDYEPVLTGELEKQGYVGEYCRHVGQGDGQGDATYFKTDKFELLQVERFTFNEMLAEAVEGKLEEDKEILEKSLTDETFMILKLKHLKTGTTFAVGNIHTIWENFTRLDISALHIALSLAKLANSAGNNTFIIAGDFNSPPHLAPYGLLKNGQPSDSQKTKLVTEASVRVNGKSMFELLEYSYQHESQDLTSSYLEVLGMEPGLTIYQKYDGQCLLDTCLDYIWFTSTTLEVVSVLDTATPTRYLPDQVFPSDHLSLKSSYRFKTVSR